MSSTASPGPERRVGALDLPPDIGPGVGTLLSIAAGPATDDELTGETTAVAAFLAQRGEQPARRPRLPVRSVRVAAAVFVTSVVLGGGLAAADVLPAPAQRWVSRALDAVGIEVPSPDHPAAAVLPLTPRNEEVSGFAASELPAPTTVTLPQPPSTTGAAGSRGGAALRPGAPDAASGAGAVTGGSGTSTARGDGNGTSAHGSGAASATGTSGSTAKGYGAGGNPAHGNAGDSKEPSSSSARSSAHGKPADPGHSTEGQASAPGQARKPSGPAASSTRNAVPAHGPVGRVSGGPAPRS